jgi:glycosyltransferase involved in cell wall biosynthesis
MAFYTIIIPTFNSGNHLKDCLLSVLKQTERDFEIIIQDGQSADATLQIAKSFSDPRIRIFSEPDTGVYDAMNKALEKIRGNWVFFLGSDDSLLNEDTLKKVRPFLTNTQARLVYGDVIISGDNKWAKDGDIYRGETSALQLLYGNISHQASFYDRRVFAKKKFNTDYRICADWDFNLYCFAAYKTQYIPLTISVFSTGGLSSLNEDRVFEANRWYTIIDYFKLKLLALSMPHEKTHFKATAKKLWRSGHYKHSCIAFMTYLAQKYFQRT